MDKWDENEFQEFLKSDGHIPSAKVSKQIVGFVKRDLDPPHSIVFLKLLFIQTFVGIITMTFCPQFDLSLTNNYELFHYFHRQFGRTICMAICGGIFVGSGAIAAAFILKSPEVAKISKSPLLYYFAISSIFLSGFLIVGVDAYLDISIAWILGAALVGALLHVTSKSIRRMIRSSAYSY